MDLRGLDWKSAQELADAKLPGVPRTATKVNAKARAESWQTQTDERGRPLMRKRVGRGGGWEYHVSLLPQAARTMLALVPAATIAPNGAVVANDGLDNPHAARWAWFDRQPAATKAHAERRRTILTECEALIAAGLTKTAAVAEMHHRHGDGTSTILTWYARIAGVADRANWLPYLSPEYAGGRQRAGIDEGAWRFILADYDRAEQPTWEHCYRRCQEEYAGSRGIVLPSAKTLKRRYDAEVPQLLSTLRRRGPDALEKLTPALKRLHCDYAMQGVNADGHKFDVFVELPDGRVVRPIIVGVQDIYSKKLLAWRIGETESALLVRRVFVELFRTHGFPEECVFDNGRAFQAKELTGGSEFRFRGKVLDTDPLGLLSRFDIRHHATMPYHGQSKPIERAWRDLVERISRHPRVAGAFTGTSPDAKPHNHGARAIPLAEFEALVAQQIPLHNAQIGRRNARLGSFDADFGASIERVPVRRATPEQLRLALLSAEERTCHRDSGAVSLYGNSYHDEALWDLAGKKVVVRYDPDALHSEVHIYRQSGEFVCTAPVIEAVGFFDKKAAKEIAAKRRDVRRRARQLERDADYLNQAELAALTGAPVEPAPPVRPKVTRMVRDRGATAAARKPDFGAAEQAAEPQFIDRFAENVNRRLRIVDE